MNWTEDQLAAHQSRLRKPPKPDSGAVVMAKAVKPKRRAKIKAKAPLERAIVLSILQYLQAVYPEYCFVRVEPVTGVRMALKRSGKMRGGKWADSAWSDGVADILGFRDGWLSIAFEVKRPGKKQRPSQVEFQQRWEAAGGIYRVVSSPEDAATAMREL